MYKVNPGNWVLKENDLEGAKFIWKNFESRKSDVWIVTPPKVIFQLISKFDKCKNMKLDSNSIIIVLSYVHTEIFPL